MKTSRTVIAANEAAVVALPTAATPADRGIVSKALLESGATRVVLFHFDTDQELTEHATPCRALIQLVSGRGEFKVGGKVFALGPGDFLHMPPAVPHAVRALEPMVFLLTMIREPAPGAIAST